MHCRTWCQNRAGNFRCGRQSRDPRAHPTTCPSGPACPDLLGLWGHMCRLLSAYRTSSDAWCSQSLDSWGTFKPLLCSQFGKIEDIWNQGSLVSVPGQSWTMPALGSEPPAWRSRPYFTTVYFFTERKCLAINHVVLADVPEPSPWKGDPELRSLDSVVTISRSNRFPWWEGEKVFPGTFKVRGWTDTSALVKRKRIKDRAMISLYGVRGTVSKPRYRFFFHDSDFWGIHIIWQFRH